MKGAMYYELPNHCWALSRTSIWIVL